MDRNTPAGAGKRLADILSADGGLSRGSIEVTLGQPFRVKVEDAYSRAHGVYDVEVSFQPVLRQEVHGGGWVSDSKPTRGGPPAPQAVVYGKVTLKATGAFEQPLDPDATIQRLLDLLLAGLRAGGAVGPDSAE